MFIDLTENNNQTLAYFPDNCAKRTPPKTYFWMVYSILKPNLFRHLIESAIRNAQGTNPLPDKITLTPEMNQIFDTIDNSSSLVYARKLNSGKEGKSFKST